MTPLRRGWSWRAIGPKKPTQGRKHLERAAALGQIDALKVLDNALSEGGYRHQPSPTKAKPIKVHFDGRSLSLAETPLSGRTLAPEKRRSRQLPARTS